MSLLPASMYTKEYPPLSEIEKYSLSDLQAFAKTLENDVTLVREENTMVTNYMRSMTSKDRAAQGGGAGGDGRGGDGSGQDGDDAAQAAGQPAKSGGGRRTGTDYKTKRQTDQKDLYLTPDDQVMITTAEQERLKQERDKTERMIDDSKELIRATIEDCQTQIKEAKMDMAFFKREVIGESKDVSADKILKFFADRPAFKETTIRKWKEKCTSLHQQIAKHQSQLRQREDVGEAFHTIDFDQLKIENHQFNERIEQKNEELVELKGTTTRTVQSLNGLTDKLNGLLAQQTQLRKELKLRQDHVDKLEKEIEQVKKEGLKSQKRNAALKIQHEAVKAPKVEDYIAQKAEMYEMEKAAHDWERKVEIADGHVRVMKQQMLACQKQLQGGM